MSDSTNVLRKITAKKVGLSAGVNGVGESVVIYGRANQARPGETDLGVYMEFAGAFEALNEGTGEIYRAGKAILPGGLMEDELSTALNSAKENDRNASIDFAVRFKKVKADNPMGCEWQAETLQQPDQSDPVAQLRQGLANKVKQLAAPQSEQKKAN